MNTTTIDATFYREYVLPQVSSQQSTGFFCKYPAIRFDEGYSVGTTPMVILSALTGTGKTTTLNLLANLMPIYCNRIPSRRDLADMLIIPTAQVITGDAVRPISDRVERFRYTRLFAEYISGGYAAAYQWLYLTDEPEALLICEGIRGQYEIMHALTYCPQWRIIELSANPLTRLYRLSDRNDAFDQATGAINLEFLPKFYRASIQSSLDNRTITHQALKIMQAEAANYGLMPSAVSHPHYRLLETDNLAAQAVAQQVKDMIIAWQA